MGFFSSQQNYSAGQQLGGFLKKSAWKMLFVTVGWVALFFATQLIKEGPLMLLNLIVGSIAGLVIGWSMAEDAVQDSGLVGLSLWTLLVALGGLPILVVETVMHWITRWEMGFGRWMCISAALIMMLASTVWRASADE